MYLIRNKGNKVAAHIWDGEDTACRMYSCGGFKKEIYKLHETPLEKQICHMCSAAKEKTMPRRETRSQRKGFYESQPWQIVRYRAIKLYGAQCQCCGQGPSKKNPLHVDHIKPRSKFPALELEISNLQVLCRDCNLGKRAWDQTDWRPKCS